jgi:dsRNA-specific ribonuclease
MAGQSLANWVIPLLPPTLLQGLPARMEVADVTAAVNSITHPSRYGLPAHPNSLAPGTPDSDYEKLEHLGDNIVGKSIKAAMRYQS